MSSESGERNVSIWYRNNKKGNLFTNIDEILKKYQIIFNCI